MTALPVRDAVSNYEKISRIGEGTYGVVCESLILCSPGVLIPWLCPRVADHGTGLTPKTLLTCRQS